jgi:hypothetical protein
MSISSGWSSYAALLENRVITQSWSGYHRTKGRFIFRRIYTEDEEGYRNETIGFEMVCRTNYEPWRRQASGIGEYIFQCYHDGVALYKKELLRNVLYHWKAKVNINAVIDHYYNVDQTIVPTVGDQWEKARNTILVLRRKPVCDIAKAIYAQGADLGEFLVNKYNMREEVAANV